MTPTFYDTILIATQCARVLWLITFWNATKCFLEKRLIWMRGHGVKLYVLKCSEMLHFSHVFNMLPVTRVQHLFKFLSECVWKSLTLPERSRNRKPHALQMGKIILRILLSAFHITVVITSCPPEDTIFTVKLCHPVMLPQ